MKKLAFAICGIILLVVGGALVAPGFVDWNQYKEKITEQVRDATGRDVTINGDIKATILPSPMMALNGVRVANVPGGAAKDMVALKSIEVRVALFPLLKGQVQVESVRLVDPVIELERFADGRANWLFGPIDNKPVSATSSAEAPTQAEADGQGAAPQFPVRIDKFEVINGVVRFRDGAGTVEHLDGIDATIGAASLIGPFDARGSLVARGVPLNLEASVGKIIHDRTLPFAISLWVGGAATGAADAKIVKADISGSLVGLDAEPKMKAKLSVVGASLAELAALAPQDGSKITTVPGFLARDFTLTSTLLADAKTLQLSDIAFQLGQTRAVGSVQVALGDVPDIAANLAIKTIDLDDWLRAKEVSIKALPLPVHYRTAGNGRGSSASAVLVQANIPEKRDDPTKAKFKFPDDIRVALDVTADTVSYQGGLVHQAQVSLALADGELGINQASAQLPGSTDVALFGFVFAPKGVAKFEGNVEATTSNLRSLLAWLKVEMPDVPTDRLRRLAIKTEIEATQDRITATDSTIQFDSSKITGGFVFALGERLSFGVGARLDQLNLDAYLPKPSKRKATAASKPAAKVGPFAVLNGLALFDADLDLRVDRLRHLGETARDIRLNGTLHGGTLELRKLSVANYAGVSAKLGGRFSGLGGVPTAAGVSLDLAAKNTAKLFKLTGIKPPAHPTKLGAVSARVKVNGSLLTPKVQLNVNALGGEIRAKGAFSPLDLLTGVSVDLSVSHPNLYSLTRSLNLDYRPAKTVGGFKLAARVKGVGQSVEIRNLTGTIGKTVVAGNAGVSNLGGKKAGGRPKIVADLNFNNLVVDPYLSAQARAKNKAAAKRRKDVANRKPQKTATARWSRQPIDMSALRGFDAAVKVRGKRLTYDRFQFSDVVLNATLSDGILDVSQLTGGLFAGRFVGGAKLSVPGSSITGRMNLRDASMGAMLKAATGKKSAVGVLNFNVDFAARGASEFAMISSLGGAGQFALTGVELKGTDGKGSAMAGLVNLLGAMNTMAGGFLINQGGSKDGKSALTGSFKAKKGVVRSTDMKLISGMGDGVARGAANLPKWTLDAQGEIQMKRNLLTALLATQLRVPDVVPFTLAGPLDAPKVRLGTKRAAKPASGVGGAELQRRQQSSPTTTRPPTDSKKISPVDILKKLLR